MVPEETQWRRAVSLIENVDLNTCKAIFSIVELLALFSIITNLCVPVLTLVGVCHALPSCMAR